MLIPSTTFCTMHGAGTACPKKSHFELTGYYEEHAVALRQGMQCTKRKELTAHVWRLLLCAAGARALQCLQFQV